MDIKIKMQNNSTRTMQKMFIFIFIFNKLDKEAFLAYYLLPNACKMYMKI